MYALPCLFEIRRQRYPAHRNIFHKKKKGNKKLIQPALDGHHEFGTKKNSERPFRHEINEKDNQGFFAMFSI